MCLWIYFQLKSANLKFICFSAATWLLFALLKDVVINILIYLHYDNAIYTTSVLSKEGLLCYQIDVPVGWLTTLMAIFILFVTCVVLQN